jgi:gamma-glutamyl:cysteine ligase YbdK (ATP-grasp superfamily)
MTSKEPLHLFEAYGIELELMLVRADDLGVYPVSDRVLVAAGDRLEGEVEREATGWSNELVLHVIELKTRGPRPSLDGLAKAFHGDVTEIDAILESLGGRLLGTGMHPTMLPLVEARLWPHGTHEVYRAYDRAFGCRGHGFSNLQSVHVNLPFAGDAEFGRLHAAIRLVLPLLPAIAAASPIVEGSVTGQLDTRLAVYRKNQRLVPSVTGMVIPERAYTRRHYEDRILRVIAKDIERLDVDDVLDPEWVNSRGAIARFSRDAIEIRVIDAQESATQSVGVAAAAVAVVRALVEERWAPFAEQTEWHESFLEPIFTAAVTSGGDAVIGDERLLACFGVQGPRCSLRELWAHLASLVDARVDGATAALDVILRQGTLSERILRATGPAPAREKLHDVYGELASCLREDRAFAP